MRRFMRLPVCLFFVAMSPFLLSSLTAEAQSVVVGRVFEVEGDLLRYVPTEQDWVAVVRDAPFGVEDTLFSGSQGRTELIIPNGTWIRIGYSTQIEFITLERNLSEIDVASGVARFYNKGSDTVIKATCPFGYVLAYPGTIFDYYVGDNSVEIIAIQGTVSFVHSATEARYDVLAGSPSIIADQQQVSSGEGTVDADWDQWSLARDDYWAAKARMKGRSFEYLPPSLQDEAYVLEENGRWEQIDYQGRPRWFWRPVRIAAGWSPFTVGRWTDWYGDQTWIPAEPFGYLTHHYGNWVIMGGVWFWAPPVVSVRVGLPLLDVGFYWYPGRVAWIHSGTYVGWVPLAPNEPYYCSRPWGGPRVVVVNNVNITQININIQNYAYINRAVVVNQNNFYNVSNYTNVRVMNINRTTIINNYRAAPVVNDRVISNYSAMRQRFNYANVTVKEKPHNEVLSRIKQNQAMIREGRTERATALQERVKSIRQGRVSREARIEQPKITNKVVPANEVNRPKSEMKLPQREIKTRAKPVEAEKPHALPGRPVPTKPEFEKPGARPERPVPSKPETGKPGGRPERVVPPKSEMEKPGGRPGLPGPPERPIPPKPEMEKPAGRPERPILPKPEIEKPSPRPERPIPPKPEMEKPAGRPERPILPKPEIEKPSPRPERPIPPKPEMEKPAGRPERPIPPKPEMGKPRPGPEREMPPKQREPEKPGQPG